MLLEISRISFDFFSSHFPTHATHNKKKTWRFWQFYILFWLAYELKTCVIISIAMSFAFYITWVCWVWGTWQCITRIYELNSIWYDCRFDVTNNIKIDEWHRKKSILRIPCIWRNAMLSFWLWQSFQPFWWGNPAQYIYLHLTFSTGFYRMGKRYNCLQVYSSCHIPKKKNSYEFLESNWHNTSIVGGVYKN